MLFDLQGKRRRVVQFTYVMLALLMGGGLVIFGIGGNISGGLADALKGGGGGGNGNSIVEKRVSSNEKKLKASPTSVPLRKALTRDYYQLAVSAGSANGTFSADAKADLRKSAANWQAYLTLAGPKPDTSLARLALQLYAPDALNRTTQAKQTAQLIASQQNDASSYLALVQYATLDKDTRTADLAGQKAIDLAPSGQKKAVRAQIKQLKTQQAAGQAPGATPSQ